MSIEVMRQALDALENVYGRGKRCDAAIAALRQAIEQTPICAHGVSKIKCDFCNQVEQAQPVAWMHNLIEDNIISHRPADIDRYPERWTSLYRAPKPCPTCESLARTVMMDQVSYDARPQREWVGLTPEEVKEISLANRPYVIDMVRALEQRLQEKNR